MAAGEHQQQLPRHLEADAEPAAERNQGDQPARPARRRRGRSRSPPGRASPAPRPAARGGRWARAGARGRGWRSRSRCVASARRGPDHRRRRIRGLLREGQGGGRAWTMTAKAAIRTSEAAAAPAPKPWREGSKGKDGRRDQADQGHQVGEQRRREEGDHPAEQPGGGRQQRARRGATPAPGRRARRPPPAPAARSPAARSPSPGSACRRAERRRPGRDRAALGSRPAPGPAPAPPCRPRRGGGREVRRAVLRSRQRQLAGGGQRRWRHVRLRSAAPDRRSRPGSRGAGGSETVPSWSASVTPSSVSTASLGALDELDRGALRSRGEGHDQRPGEVACEPAAAITITASAGSESRLAAEPAGAGARPSLEPSSETSSIDFEWSTPPKALGELDQRGGRRAAGDRAVPLPAVPRGRDHDPLARLPGDHQGDVSKRVAEALLADLAALDLRGSG